MMILALFLALGIGISLGLLGSGGSIITLPVLVYVANVPAAEAVPMSLAVVGGTTLVASIFNARSARVPLKRAIATSLVVITVTSAAGLIGHLRRTHFDWGMAGMFLALAVIGMLAGRKFANHLETERLRYWFAWFVLAVAVFVIAENWKVFR